MGLQWAYTWVITQIENNMLFKIRAERKNQYGNKEVMTCKRERENAWMVSEELRIEGWTNNKIKII